MDNKICKFGFFFFQICTDVQKRDFETSTAGTVCGSFDFFFFLISKNMIVVKAASGNTFLNSRSFIFKAVSWLWTFQTLVS